MALMETNHVKNAIQKAGGTSVLATHLGVSYQAVQQWAKASRVPAEHCPKIERLTAGAVRCEELNDRVDWAYLRAAAGQAV